MGYDNSFYLSHNVLEKCLGARLAVYRREFGPSFWQLLS